MSRLTEVILSLLVVAGFMAFVFGAKVLAADATDRAYDAERAAIIMHKLEYPNDGY